VERSLVARTGGDAYRLLDTVRQFAAERLSESDEVEQTRERLVVAYSELVESAAEDVKEVRLGMSAIFRELDSVRLVVDRLEATDSARFVRVAALSCPALYYRGRYREGLDLARRAARAPTDSSADRALANLYLAPLANMTGHHDEAAAAAAAALEAFEREGDIDWMIEALGMSAVSETRLGNVSLARTRLERAASLGEEGGRVPISRTLNLLACNEIVAGEFEAAEAFARRAVAALPEGKSLLGPAAASVTLAVALAGQGRFLEALPFSRQALRMELEGRGAQPDTDILRTPVVIELGLSHLERAATLAAAVEAIDEEAGTPGTAFPILADGVEEALAFAVPEARLAFERGRQMSYLQAVRFASGDPE
jgi:tetratricopeptide (TPR) repeat protein